MNNKRKIPVDPSVFLAFAIIILGLCSLDLKWSLDKAVEEKTNIQHLRDVDAAGYAYLFYEHELEDIETEIHDLAIDIYQSYREAVYVSGYTKDQMLMETVKYSHMCESPTIDEINRVVPQMLEKHPEIRMYEVKSMYERMGELEEQFYSTQRKYNNAYNRYQSLLGESHDIIEELQYHLVTDFIY